MNEDPPFSVIVRAKGQLVEFVVTGCEEVNFEPTTVLMSTSAATMLLDDLVAAIADADRATPYLERLTQSR